MLNMNHRPDAVGAGEGAVVVPFLLKGIFTLIGFLNLTRGARFLAPLVFRLFLAPIFITFGLKKAASFESTVAWFGNADWGLGLPFPALMVGLAIGAEVIGGFCLLIGIFTRWVCIPLMITMIVAMSTAHLSQGWHAIAPSDSTTNIATVTQYVGFPGATQSLENTKEVQERLSKAKALLQEHGNYDYLTERGSFVVLNNGVEFGFIYFAMVLSLFFTGAGMLSFDHFFVQRILPWLMRL